MSSVPVRTNKDEAAPQAPSSFLSSAVQSIINHFKPHRAEAFQRIRVNTFCLVVMLILSNLWPLPSLPAALRTVMSSARHERWSSEWLYRWFCIVEVAAASVFAFNILESLYALKYPRPPLPTTVSPAKTKPIRRGGATPKRPFTVLSPNTSPQVQKPFSSASVVPLSDSLTKSASGYPVSPLSTPSRVLHYPPVPPSTAKTQASSTSSFGYQSTPSPVVSAYRGKHFSSSIGHPVDGSFLSRIAASEDSDEEYDE